VENQGIVFQFRSRILFSHATRVALGPSQYPLRWGTGIVSKGWRGRSVKL